MIDHEHQPIISNGRKIGHVEYRKDARNRWRWTLWARGNAVCNCSEGDGFRHLSEAKRNFNAAKRLISLASS